MESFGEWGRDISKGNFPTLYSYFLQVSGLPRLVLHGIFKLGTFYLLNQCVLPSAKFNTVLLQ